MYTKKRPTDEKTSVADNFCTIIIKVTKEIKAIPLSETQKIYNPVGIDVDRLTSFVFLSHFLKSYLILLFQHYQNYEFCFIKLLMARHSLEAHDYHVSTTVRSMRSFSDVHLLDLLSCLQKAGRTMKLPYVWFSKAI